MTSGPNPIRAALAAGKPAIGGWCSLPNPYSAELLAKAGFPWVVIDLQHGAASQHDLLPLIQAVELGGAAAMVRVGGSDAAPMMRTLDTGAFGLLVPLVESAEQAARLVAAVRYPPAGGRSFGPARFRYATPREANEDIVLMVMVETEEGLRNLDAIAAVDGVDGIFVGPVDLVLSIEGELIADLRHPIVEDAIDRAIVATERHGGFVGTVAQDEEHARALLDRGVRWLTIGSDRTYMQAGANRVVAAVRGSLSAG